MSNIRWHFVLTLLVSGCATSVQTGSHLNEDFSLIAQESTVRWHESGAIRLMDETGYISPVIIELLKREVAEALVSKGFLFVSDDTASANLQIQLYLRTRRELHNYEQYDPRHGCVYPDCWYAPHSRKLLIHTRTVGFLAADVYQGDTAIWRGWIERPLAASERDKAHEIIGNTVPVLFENFPHASQGQ